MLEGIAASPLTVEGLCRGAALLGLAPGSWVDDWLVVALASALDLAHVEGRVDALGHPALCPTAAPLGLGPGSRQLVRNGVQRCSSDVALEHESNPARL